MPIYHYTAINSNGKKQQGSLSGDSPQEIYNQLNLMGLTPIDISDLATTKKSLFYFGKRISNRNLTLFTHQLASLISVGITLEMALHNIAEQMDNEQFRDALMSIRTLIQEGQTFAYSLNQYPEYFPALYRTTIMAGEKSAQLEAVLLRLAEYLETQEAIRTKILQALIYPSLLSLVSIIIIIFLLTYAMPSITNIFIENKQPMPALTQFFLTLSLGITHYGWIILLIIFFGITLLIFNLKNSNFKLFWDKLLLKLPWINKIIININVARFSRTLGILYGAHLPVLEAMHNANAIVSLLPMHYSITEAITKVSEGESIHKALSVTGFFPKITTQMIASGEASGKLESMLEKAANYQDQQITRWINVLLSLFEPAVILLMGFIVLLIVLAVLLPIFQMNEFFS